MQLCSLPRVNDIALGIAIMLFGIGLAFYLGKPFIQPKHHAYLPSRLAGGVAAPGASSPTGQCLTSLGAALAPVLARDPPHAEGSFNCSVWARMRGMAFTSCTPARSTAQISDLPANKRWRSRQIGAGIGNPGPVWSHSPRGEPGVGHYLRARTSTREPIIDKPGHRGTFCHGLDLLLRHSEACLVCKWNSLLRGSQQNGKPKIGCSSDRAVFGMNL